MIGAFWALVARDLRLAFREGGAIGTALGFYLIVVTLLPLGLGPNLALFSHGCLKPIMRMVRSR
jgi:heme exporter protein B